MLSSKMMKIYVAVFSILVSMNINATVIYDLMQDKPPSGGLNLFNNIPDVTTSGSSPALGSFLASSFSTGPGEQFLTDVKLLVQGVNPYSGSFTVSLLSDNNKTPTTVETVLATGDVSRLGSSYNVLDLAVSNFSLSGNTRYWIELTSTNEKSVLWSWAYISPTDVGVANEYFWENGVFGANSKILYPFQMQITTVQMQVSTVPLPAGFSLMGIALAMLTIFRRKPL